MCTWASSGCCCSSSSLSNGSIAPRWFISDNIVAISCSMASLPATPPFSAKCMASSSCSSLSMTTRDLAICCRLLKLFLCTLMFDATVLKSFLSNVGWMFGRLVYLLRMYFSGTLVALIVCIMSRTCTQKRPVFVFGRGACFLSFHSNKNFAKKVVQYVTSFL